MRRILVIVFSLFLVKSAIADGASSLIIDKSFHKKHLGLYMEYLKDTTLKMDVYDASRNNKDWQVSSEKSINLGYSTSAYWFRFSVNNKMKQETDFYFEIDYPVLENIDLYVPQEPNRYIVFSTGANLPFDSRHVIDRNFVFLLSVTPGKHTYYFRIHTAAPYSFSAIMMSTTAYFERMYKELPVLWMYYGLMVVMIILNLFMFASIRERAYIYCASFILTITLLHFHLNGFAFQYLWPNSTWWVQRNGFFCITLTCVFATLYSCSFIDAKKNFPAFQKILFYTVILPGIPLSILSILVGTLKSVKLPILLWSVYTAFFIFILVVYGSIKKYRQAHFMLIGLTAFLVGGALYPLKTAGILQLNIITEWSMQIGSGFMILLFTLGLTDNINTMKKEIEDSERKIRSQNKTLEDTNIQLSMSYEELKVKETQFRAMLDQLPLPVVLNKEHQIIYLNKICITAFGYTLSSITSFNNFFSQMIPEKQQRKNVWNEFKMKMKKASKGGIIELSPQKIRCRDGKILHVEIRITTIGEMILAIFKDITESKLAEAELTRHRDNLEKMVTERTIKLEDAQKELIKSEKLATIGRLAGTVSHEIRNPLGVIRSSTYFLKSKLKLNDQKAVKHLDRIDGQVDQCNSIISDLMEYSQGRMSVIYQDDIHTLLDEVLSHTHEKATDEFTIAPEYPNKPLPAFFDRSKLSLVLSNLIKNAINAVHKQKEISLDENYQSTIIIRTEEVDSAAMIKIIDNGIGMDDETFRQAFDPLFTTNTQGSSGLGLAIVKKIIAEHNGSISLESKPNQGTSVSFTIPSEKNS